MINVLEFLKTNHSIFGLSKIRIVINYIKNIFLKTNIKNPVIFDNYNFDLNKKEKVYYKKGDYIITTRNGLFLLNKSKINNIFSSKLGFFGLCKYKNFLYIAFYGNGHSKGCIFRFKINKKFICFDKVVFKKKFQYFHEINIYKNEFYVVDSSWITPHENLISFKIDKKGDLIEKKIFNLKKFVPSGFKNLCHVNGIYVKRNYIYVLFHNLSQYTNTFSKILKFKKYKSIIKFKSIFKGFDKFKLLSAHNMDIKNKMILSSGDSRFIIKDKIINFKNFFLKGLLITKNFYIIGANSNYHKKKSVKNNILFFLSRKNLNIKKKIMFKYNINQIIEL